MTELGSAGMAEVEGGGEDGAWCSPRRDTRGRRGYDGAGGAGMTGGRGAGRAEVEGRRRGQGLVLATAGYPRQARV